MQTHNVDIRELYNYDEFDKIIEYLKETRLESFGNSNIIYKTITKLQQLENMDKIKEILLIIAKYKINVLESELKEGLKILINK